MKHPCGECGASAVWTRLIDFKPTRGTITMHWRCQQCGATWIDKHAAAPSAVKVKTLIQPRRRTRKLKS